MPSYLLESWEVARAVERLLGRRTHPHLPGYLCVKREARVTGQVTGLKPDFDRFFDEFFAVTGGPAGSRYYRPFWYQSESKVKAWYGKNLAGTYSIKSAVRHDAFTKVVEVDVEKRAFALRPGHDRLALEHLALGDRLSAYDLALFLYRDYAFDAPSVPSAVDLVAAFRHEFGYAVPRTDGAERATPGDATDGAATDDVAPRADPGVENEAEANFSTLYNPDVPTAETPTPFRAAGGASADARV